ncbi:MAG: type I-C CRISPR-associated protein Cas8c/Csd1, partial [Acidobacteriota bacterium]
AMKTPRSIFIRLSHGARHHAKKASNNPKTAKTAYFLERQLDEVFGAFPLTEDGIPSRLTSGEQGLFVIGYHQQRASFFRKRDASPSESLLPENNPAAADGTASFAEGSP